ncbi:hypothetical protein QBC34DRAFT_467491 [Podospora aff. communis PSN243]|uniref:Hypervirulence associated protein TUDOR domain-containing protein n=1 Tax=Podospora aff. communis PSN243 TaxID=3040156 RepID=A0AAV9GF18_9PEZI|nr:hypothetical protein QBC34DRAFT_467491 [Podospora aff. communis PSN243]
MPNSWTAGKQKAMDLDQSTTQAPPITQETIKPSQHEIVQEQIHREVHTHEVHPHIQPVIERKVLPARHYVHDKHGKLVEVPEGDIHMYICPDSEGEEQKKETTTRKVVESSRTERDIPPEEVGVVMNRKKSLMKRVKEKVRGC